MRKKLLIATILNALVFCHASEAARTFGQVLCKYDGFNCVRVKRNQSWQSLFPNEREREMVMRINRMNTSIWPGMIIAVPETLHEANIMDFAPFQREISPIQEKLIVIDPIYQAWGAYDAEGRLVRWGPASSGADYCKDIDDVCQTHPGSFRIFSLGSSDCYSTKFPLPKGGAPMPYCMYFNNGQALHGEPNGLPGYNASHGCVRLFVNDAEWLRYDFAEGANSSNNFKGTKVIVRKYYQDDDIQTEKTEES